ncbi:hypothetical protein [Streptomyces sp. NPDC058664]
MAEWSPPPLFLVALTALTGWVCAPRGNAFRPMLSAGPPMPG